MKRNMVPKYLSVARSVAEFSKDRSTKVGAVIIGPDGEGGPWGYNGFPRGCDDNDDYRHQRPEKYLWTEHAERNAIYNAARTGFSTKGCAIFITHPPCMDCARAIVQAGIKLVVWVRGGLNSRWDESTNTALQLFEETGVKAYSVTEEQLNGDNT